MNKLDKLNDFLNDLDIMGIATEENEYEIEAIEMLHQFDVSMDINQVESLFRECMLYFFSTECVLSQEELLELYDILKSQ